jgi:hypothetical protein
MWKASLAHKITRVASEWSDTFGTPFIGLKNRQKNLKNSKGAITKTDLSNRLPTLFERQVEFQQKNGKSQIPLIYPWNGNFFKFLFQRCI